MIETFKTAGTVASIPTVAVVIGEVSNTLSGSTNITLGEAVACVIFISMLALFVGRKFSNQQSMHKANQIRFSRIEMAIDKLLKRAGIDFSISEKSAAEESED